MRVKHKFSSPAHTHTHRLSSDLGSSWDGGGRRQSREVFIARRRPQLGIFLIRHVGCADPQHCFICTYAHTQTHRERFECSTWVKSWLKDKANVCKCIMSSTPSSFYAFHNVVLHLHLVFLLLIVPRLCQFPFAFAIALLLLVNWIKVQMLAINITKKLMPHVCAACGACVRLCLCLHVWLCGCVAREATFYQLRLVAQCGMGVAALSSFV